MKKSIILISVGIFNFLHGMFHLIQFIQSMLLVAYSVEVHNNDSWIDKITHSPVFAVIWAVIGIITLVIGIKDFIHHRNCKKHKH